ncbi:Uma2 family endonuclease [Pseudanabaena sp. FACHB-1998]|uniref:Uma2 family endonuclease n=1 Tax=Pseudanabaena sp. FACHB-1998 TaxID=2692858 RepID=UPI0016808FE6|nr:Uma2 family endonuclease [Pseudanabaena sp. FACHB-1998]MBD2178666.1 Uma2 family endonuclease [Pseudanabaena sp. FACHB-1998]
MRSPIHFFSVAEYLEAESKSEIRHEYLGGQVFAMAGGSKAHNMITLNIASLLRSLLRGNACDVFMSDMKVKLKAANQNKTIFYYPDVLFTCNPEDRDKYFVNYPCAIFEVLSPSTEVSDRREKLVNYQTIESLQEYVLVSQDKIQVEVYRQDLKGNWTMEVLGNEDILVLNSINRSLTMADIYEGIF